MHPNTSPQNSPSFRDHLPSFSAELAKVKIAFNYEADFFHQIKKIFDSKTSELMAALTADLQVFMEFEWKVLQSYSKGVIALHTMKVALMIYCDPHFDSLSSEDQSILFWAAIMHDIAKRGSPKFLTKDHVHPFNSSIVALRILNRLGVLKCDENKLEELSRIIATSIKKKAFAFLYPTVCCDVIHDHSKVDSFMPMVRQVCNSRFAYSIFVMIAFHQSITVLKQFPHQSVLSEAQVLSIFNPHLMSLYKLLMAYDTLSYTYRNSKESHKNKAEVFLRINYWHQKLTMHQTIQ